MFVAGWRFGNSGPLGKAEPGLLDDEGLAGNDSDSRCIAAVTPGNCRAGMDIRFILALVTDLNADGLGDSALDTTGIDVRAGNAGWRYGKGGFSATGVLTTISST